MTESTPSRINLVLPAVAAVILIIVMGVYLLQLVDTGHTSDADFDTVSAAVLSAADLDPMVEGDNQMIRRIYGLDPASYEGMLLYYPSSNMGCEELLLVKLSDLSQQEAVQEAMEARISTQRDAFEGYAPDQYDMLGRGVVSVQGNYLLLIVADDTDAVLSAFLKAL